MIYSLLFCRKYLLLLLILFLLLSFLFDFELSIFMIELLLKPSLLTDTSLNSLDLTELLLFLESCILLSSPIYALLFPSIFSKQNPIFRYNKSFLLCFLFGSFTFFIYSGQVLSLITNPFFKKLFMLK